MNSKIKRKALKIKNIIKRLWILIPVTFMVGFVYIVISNNLNWGYKAKPINNSKEESIRINPDGELLEYNSHIFFEDIYHQLWHLNKKGNIHSISLPFNFSDVSESSDTWIEFQNNKIFTLNQYRSNSQSSSNLFRITPTGKIRPIEKEGLFGIIKGFTSFNGNIYFFSTNNYPDSNGWYNILWRLDDNFKLTELNTGHKFHTLNRYDDYLYIKTEDDNIAEYELWRMDTSENLEYIRGLEKWEYSRDSVDELKERENYLYSESYDWQENDTVLARDNERLVYKRKKGERFSLVLVENGVETEISKVDESRSNIIFYKDNIFFLNNQRTEVWKFDRNSKLELIAFTGELVIQGMVSNGSGLVLRLSKSISGDWGKYTKDEVLVYITIPTDLFVIESQKTQEKGGYPINLEGPVEGNYDFAYDSQEYQYTWYRDDYIEFQYPEGSDLNVVSGKFNDYLDPRIIGDVCRKDHEEEEYKYEFEGVKLVEIEFPGNCTLGKGIHYGYKNPYPNGEIKVLEYKRAMDGTLKPEDVPYVGVYGDYTLPFDADWKLTENSLGIYLNNDFQKVVPSEETLCRKFTQFFFKSVKRLDGWTTDKVVMMSDIEGKTCEEMVEN